MLEEIVMKRKQKELIGFLLMVCLFLQGCGLAVINPMEKIRDVEYTVMTEENIPEEVMREINTRKEKEFKLTFRDGENLYICIGYGEKERGGYSVSVLELYEARNGVYVETELTAPNEENPSTKKTPTYPFIVIKTEYQEKPVVFL